jgi:hypothetical protein
LNQKAGVDAIHHLRPTPHDTPSVFDFLWLYILEWRVSFHVHLPEFGDLKAQGLQFLRFAIRWSRQRLQIQ